jgi:nicotinate-nucleotide pyrophosphorylase (carboxylating)
MNTHRLPDCLIIPHVQKALAEDLGRAGDITSRFLVGNDVMWTAGLVSRQEGVLAGIDFARLAFTQVDHRIVFEAFVEDGQTLSQKQVIARVSGRASSLLAAERTALNYLSHLSGIATLTKKYVDEVYPYKTSICCTRKTTPGLRAAEKYAVRMGGGKNHRFGLDDAVMIKDNHIAVVGDIVKAIELARQAAGHVVKIEVEIDTFDQLKKIRNASVDIVMLDNMSVEDMRRCIAYAEGRFVFEASGGMTLERVKDVASTGVDVISIGAITHSAPVLDIAMDNIG